MRVCDNDASIIFAPPALEAAIQAAGARAGDVIQIDRLTHTDRQTRKKVVDWEVAIVGDAQEPQPPARPAPAQRAAAPPAAAARPPAHREITSDAAELVSAYAAAIEATAAAEQYAAATGLRDIRFSDRETITRLAVTVFINRSEKGGRN
jgi:hypothetical protein